MVMELYDEMRLHVRSEPASVHLQRSTCVPVSPSSFVSPPVTRSPSLLSAAPVVPVRWQARRDPAWVYRPPPLEFPRRQQTSASFDTVPCSSACCYCYCCDWMRDCLVLDCCCIEYRKH